MKSKNTENIKEILKQCFGKEKNERYNAIAMLIVFGLFLTIAIIIARIDPASSTTQNQKPQTTTPPPTNITPKPTDHVEDIEQNTGDYEINYSYLYTFNLNGVEEVITGKRLDTKEIFTIINNNGSTEYAKLSDNYLKKENGKYQLINKPSMNLNYSDLEPLLEILENLPPSLNLNQYSYSVPTSMLLKEYYPESTQAVPTETYNSVIMTRNNNTIERLDIDYSNFYSFLTGTISTYTATMEFNNIGTTEDFIIKVD
ncbi:MAG: hypothetical protein HFG40_03395 [Bacilli bacterium]|nr:hypothetical protein [Bacilli bacterium]